MPVGRRDHELVVVVLTLIVLTFAALYLIKCIRKKVKSIKFHVNRGSYDEKEEKEDKSKCNSEESSSFSEDLNEYNDKIQPKRCGKSKKPN